MASSLSAVLDDVFETSTTNNKPRPDSTNVSTSNHNSVNNFNGVPSKRQSRRGSAGGSMTTTGTKTNYKREIAALEFLLGIPMKAERDIVHQGWLQQNGMVKKDKKSDDTSNAVDPMVQSSENIPPLVMGHQGTWWEKWVANPTKQPDLSIRSTSGNIEEEELEQPHQLDERSSTLRQLRGSNPVAAIAPGRRLMGDDAIRIKIPPELRASNRRQIARLAAKREWELQVAHGIQNRTSTTTTSPSKTNNDQHPPMLDGRIFFSAAGSYPCQVFSVIRYEPKREEAARRRKKLEARGGGGSEFLVPSRDWRGISYRALLPTREKRRKIGTKSKKEYDVMMFDRFRRESDPLDNLNSTEKTTSTGSEILDDSEEDDESDEDEPDTYVPGLLDDPEMTFGRHRNVMVGDRTTGCIVASTIQFVQPALLKADLNRQFRERFEGWEPPKVMRKFIGAKIVDGIFTLMEDENSSEQKTGGGAASRQASVSSLSPGGAVASEMIIRMPPSLTLSKIRSLKQQALMAAIKARLEISTVALAIIYFERLCLDCRIDKSNRRLSFAACLLLAIKINESHVSVAKTDEKSDPSTTGSGTTNRIQSLYRQTKKSHNTFAILLEFFTQEWEISLKHLFSAEWGVFAALQFRLHAKPSQVAFHFRRLLKSQDWNPRRYLGGEMFSLWQAALAHEDYLRQEKQVRQEVRQQKKEKEKMMRLQREIVSLDTIELGAESDMGAEEGNDKAGDTMDSPKDTPPRPARTKSLPAKSLPKKQSRLGLSILNRFGSSIGSNSKRSLSTERVPEKNVSSRRERGARTPHKSPSRPIPILSPSASLPSLALLMEREEPDSETMGANAHSSTLTSTGSFRQTNSDGGGDDDDDSMSEHSETSVIMI